MIVPEVKINQTHICVLKKKNHELFVCYEPLIFEFNFEFSNLEKKIEDSNETGYEFEQYLKKWPFELLLNHFNYCQNLSGNYQSYNSYKFTELISYEKKLNDYKSSIKSIDQNKSFKEIQDLIHEYNKKEKIKVFEKIKQRIIPYMLDKYLVLFEKNENILAFSHRRIGWSFPKFQLNKDFEVTFNSNFGYGNSSYFFTIIHYKKIRIIPYSEWVLYRYIEVTEIIRYTRKHKLEDESWKIAMEFTSKLYNYTLTNPIDFVNKWILNECIKMIDALENLLNSKLEFVIIENYFNNDNDIKLTGLELIELKGEKISGALSFIDNLNELSLFSNIIPDLIDRILRCNLKVYNDLKLGIKKINQKIKNLNIQKRELFIILNSLKTEFDSNELFEKSIESENLLKQKEINIESTKINNKLINFQNQLNRFCSYKEVIETHFKSINKPYKL